MADRLPKLRKILDVVPRELVERSRDQILIAYIQARSRNPELAPEQFLQPIEQVEEKLKHQWGIEIDARTASDLIGDEDTSEVMAMMNEAAAATRGWGKSQVVLEHDAAHFVLVKGLRAQGQQVWFLTRDRTLESAAIRLQPDDLAFCFSHLGLLQSISPFVTTSEEEHSLADVLSAFLLDKMRPMISLFDISELALMAEFHEDIMATPPHQLVMAFDYVKSRTLRGESYRETDVPRVSLELRKFLSAEKEEQIRALQLERQRLEDEARSERDMHLAAKTAAEAMAKRNEELEGDVRRLAADVGHTMALAEGTEERRFRDHLIVGIVVALGLLFWIDPVRDEIVARVPGLTGLDAHVTVAIRLIAALAFALPSIRYIRNAKWRESQKALGLTATVAIAIATSQLLTKEATGGWADLLGLSATLGALLMAILITGHKPK